MSKSLVDSIADWYAGANAWMDWDGNVFLFPGHSPKPCINMQEPVHTEAKANNTQAK